jgi:hypothetical protein
MLDNPLEFLPSGRSENPQPRWVTMCLDRKLVREGTIYKSFERYYDVLLTRPDELTSGEHQYGADYRPLN